MKSPTWFRCAGRAFSLSLLLAVLAAMPATAQTLYENGPINGQTDAWTINFGFVVSDSFTISTGPSTITGFSFGAWLFAGDTLDSVEINISSEPYGGTQYFDQQVNVTASGCFLNQYGFNVCNETAAFNGPTLNNGTYWVNLLNGVTADGNPVYWDENSGIGCHSEGCPSQACEAGCLGTMPSEAFTVLGTNNGSSVPEPSSFVLFGSSAVALGSFFRRKMRKLAAPPQSRLTRNARPRSGPDVTP